MKRSLAVFLLLALSGCASFEVKPLDPRPNIDVDPTYLPLNLLIGPEVKDTFEAEKKIGLPGFVSSEVKDWRGSLTRGFGNGFKSSKPQSKDSNIILITKADLQFAATAASDSGSVTAVQSLLVFQAKLVDPTGKVLKRSDGTSMSKIPILSSLQVDQGVASAIESMYEKIATDFFNKKD